MILDEIKNELRDLGFEEDTTMAEYEEIVLNAINRATWLAFDTVVIPLKGWYKKNLSTETETTESVTVQNDGTTRIERVIVKTTGDAKPETVTETETRATEPEDKDIVRTTTTTDEWYPERPPVLTVESYGDTPIGIPDNLLRPVALLTAHYVWLDDDEVKAAYYYNEWETFTTSLINACMSDAKATVITKGWRF